MPIPRRYQHAGQPGSVVEDSLSEHSARSLANAGQRKIPERQPRTRPTLARTLAYLLAAVIMGALAVVLAISFVALVFNGALAEHLSKGIALVLAGGCILGLVGAFGVSMPGTIVQTQDMPAIIVSIAAGSIAATWTQGDGLFATIVLLMATTTFAVGITFYLLGRFRLGSLVRYLPYPVIGGFLAATGWLLLVGAIAMMTGQSVDIGVFRSLVSGDQLLQWGPGIAIGIALLVGSRMSGRWTAIPLGVALAFALFYATLALSGHSLQWAAQQGLLLGPFEQGGFGNAFSLSNLSGADWKAVLGQSPLILTAVALSVVGLLLNASGIEMAAGESVDLDRDLRGAGLANLLAAFSGSIPGYQQIGASLLAYKLGARSAWICVATGLACGITLLFGASILSVLPTCVFGGLVAYLGLDLLYQWLWKERRRLPPLDFAIVTLILAVTASIGILEGIAVGIAASFGVFVLTTARTSVLRDIYDGSSRFSTIDRSFEERSVLSEFGDENRVYELQGILFFGTVVKLAETVQADLQDSGTKTGRVILDFTRVHDMDSSAAYGVRKVVGTCADFGVHVALCGYNLASNGRWHRVPLQLAEGSAHFFDVLDDALAWAEQALLAAHMGSSVTKTNGLDTLFGEQLHDAARRKLTAYCERQRIPRGTVLIRQGELRRDVFYVEEGTLGVDLQTAGKRCVCLGTKTAGAVVGEMAFYSGESRTADVIARTDCVVLRLAEEALERMEQDEPELAIRFHRAVARQMTARLMLANGLVRKMSERTQSPAVAPGRRPVAIQAGQCSGGLEQGTRPAA